MTEHFKSKYIESQSHGLTEQSVVTATQLDNELTAIVKRIRDDGPLPPTEYMHIIGSHDADHFTGNMKFFALEILTRCKATRTSTILDLGCGCGRLALPICHFLDTKGTYIGVDVWADGVQWCNDNIGYRSDTFTFFTIPSVNNYYFAEPVERDENNYRLDFIPSNSIDIAFAISLFTHLRRSDARAYLKEIARVLKPDGVAYVTCFIIDHYFFEYVARTGNHVAVLENPTDKECFYAYSHQDFFAGFSMGAWNSMLNESGLLAICHETGNWAEKPGARVYQDTFVLARLPD